MRLNHIPALLLMALILLMLAACSGNPEPPGITPLPTIPARVTPGPLQTLSVPPGAAPLPEFISGGNLTQGAALYARSCTGCHGQQGEGGIGPNLRSSGYLIGAGARAIFETIAYGRPGTQMPAWRQGSGGAMSDQDIMDVMSFLYSLVGNAQLPGRTPLPSVVARATLPPVQASPTTPAKAAGTPAAPPAGGGNATQGAALYKTNCVACHGANGEGGIGTALRNSAYIKSAGDTAIFETIANGRPGTAMPAWSKAKGGALSDQDINDIIAFLKTMQ